MTESDNIDNFLKNTDTVFVSLGFNCFVKKFIDYKVGQKETHFFDYIGTSMWSINKIMENKFFVGNQNCDESNNELFIKTDYDDLEIFDKMNLITNKKYYLRFQHDLNKDSLSEEKKEEWEKFVDKYKRRSKRFIEMMNEIEKTNKKVIFIRLEEYKNRIIYNEKNLEKSDINELTNFFKIIKSMWKNINMRIIYFSREENTILLPEQLVINYEKKMSYHNCEKEIYLLLKKNIDYVNKL